jgi:hypothetical protein
MGRLREGCKEPYSHQAGCIISLALTKVMVLTLYHKCLHFFIYIYSKSKLFDFSKSENCILLWTEGVVNSISIYVSNKFIMKIYSTTNLMLFNLSHGC